jgi:superfamily I DNA and RNA helicase
MNGQLSIIKGTNDKPAASAELAAMFAGAENYQGQLLVGYPLIGSPDGRHAIDAVWISPTKGIIIFDLIEGNDPAGYDFRQDDAANKLEARLRTHRELTEKRTLLIPIRTVSFAPGVADPRRFEVPGYNLASNEESLKSILDREKWAESNHRTYEVALSAIQSISTIRSSKAKRVTNDEQSRGAKLKRLEDSIATLDNRQGKAVLETVEGVQRIRGLAGSGKTIVLALKAAYLHAQHPDWRIAVTFNTRSLKGQFRRLINNFSVEQAGEEPDWDQLRILNAWGAPGGAERDGIYHEFCKSHGIEYFDLRAAKQIAVSGHEFAKVCEKALGEMREKKPLYDAILVDEAQDFPPAFLRICYEALSDKKRLVYAYDELQNLSNDSMPPPEDLFGKNADGSPRVSFRGNAPSAPQQDIILSKCYRNSRPVLVTAHALGFGIYREPLRKGLSGLVQMFDHPNLWEEIGYRLRAGELREGEYVDLYRPEETSPVFLENHSPVEDLISFHKFENEDEQAEWVSSAIRSNLEDEELRHDDIVVINPDPPQKKLGDPFMTASTSGVCPISHGTS